MDYQDTWFAKQSMTMHSSRLCEGKIYWMREYVKVFTGELVPMSKKNPDGSIDVLGARFLILSSGIVSGSYDRDRLQLSLAEHASKLKEAGANIVKKTKNKLVAIHGNETALYCITPLSAKKFCERITWD